MKGKQLGMVGLGNMGRHIAENLLSTGHSVVVFDLKPALAEPLRARGAGVAASLADLAHRAEAVLMSLPPASVAGVVDELLLTMRPGGIIIDLGNSNPASSRQLASNAAEKGIRFLDAGASGGPAGAHAATLAVMVGGDEATYRECLPIFQSIGSSVTYFGPSGAGHLAKMVNNLIMGVSTAAVAEILAFATAAGLDPLTLLESFQVGAARSFVLENALNMYRGPEKPPMEDSSWRRHPGPDQLTWALEMANELGMPMPFVSLRHELRKMQADYPSNSAQGILQRLWWEIIGPVRG